MPRPRPPETPVTTAGQCPAETAGQNPVAAAVPDAPISAPEATALENARLKAVNARLRDSLADLNVQFNRMVRRVSEEERKGDADRGAWGD